MHNLCYFLEEKISFVKIYERERESVPNQLNTTQFCCEMLRYGIFGHKMLKYGTFCHKTLKDGTFCCETLKYAFMGND